MITSPLVQAQHAQETLHHVLTGLNAAKFDQQHDTLGLFGDDSLPELPIMPTKVPFPGHVKVEASSFDVFGIPNIQPEGLDVEKHGHPTVQANKKKPTRDEGVIEEIAEEIENT